MLFNVQDFFLKLAYPLTPEDLGSLNEDEWQLMAPRDHELKPLAKLRGIAQVFREEQPDVAMLCEAGGLEALANFSRLFLVDAYEPLATPPVSDRGIETGFLVKRGLTLTRELLSHAEEPVSFLYAHEEDPQGCDVTALIASTLDLDPPGERRLSRDVPELRLTAPGATRPALVILLAHLKSAFDPDGIDKGGAARRKAEVEALLSIRRKAQTTLGDDVPIVVAGDLNGRAARPETGPEFVTIYQTTDLVDALELAGHAAHERITQITYFLDRGHATQLDYIFLPKALHPRLDAKATYVYRFRFAEGDGTIAFPGSMRERRALPSDHYPVVAVLDLDV